MYKSILRAFSPLKSSASLKNHIGNHILCQKCSCSRIVPYRNYGKDTAERLRQANKKGIRTSLYYISAVGMFTVGMSYAAVPLYRMFCQAYSYGGTTQQSHDGSKVEGMQVDRKRPIKIKFNADKAANMRWNFKPQQNEITVYPGETALAFYTAVNPTDHPVIGISTYNVLPFEAGQYFNKIQCFCFEEQMLNPHEQVDMPVFFYIDPEFSEDPYLEYCNDITLSYTFFEAKEGFKVPVPKFLQR